MSVFQSQYTRALKVIPSQYSNIPFPQKVVEGTNISVYLNSLIAGPSVDFIAANVATGDIVYNITDGTAATITNVVSENVLELNYDAFVNVDAEFIIYAASPQTSNAPQGCYLYSEGLSDIEVITLGGDRVTFNKVQAGQILPVQVVKLISTSDYGLVALW